MAAREPDPSPPGSDPPRIWTIGHSTRTQEEFLQLLQAHGIEDLADVRRYPGSRRSAHFHTDAMRQWLPAAGIRYHWLPALGGRRRPRPDSVNTAWRSESFRGYADYTATPEFAEGMEQLLAIAFGARTAIMCSELLWWRCHRALVSDVLLASGIEVLHILDAGPPQPHPFTPPARVVDGRLSYAAGPEEGARR